MATGGALLVVISCCVQIFFGANSRVADDQEISGELPDCDVTAWEHTPAACSEPIATIKPAMDRITATTWTRYSVFGASLELQPDQGW